MSDKNRQEGTTQKLPFLVQKWLRFVDYLSTDCLGGWRVLKLSHVVNFQKGGTLLACLLMMRKSGNYSTTAAVYTALHGGYGLCWLLKELIFPDPKWDRPITFASAINAFVTVLGPYWYIAYNAIMGYAEHSNMSLLWAIIVYSIGLFLMLGSDCQKYFVLKKQKGLITDGFFSRIRHPNYLGEMMIYGSFAFLSKNIHSCGVLAWVWTALFAPYILQKEASMSRYSEWKAYKKRSGLLLPCFFPSYKD